MVVDADLEAAIKAFHAAKKPIGMCCIAPVIAAHVLKATVTVGEAEGAKGRTAAPSASSRRTAARTRRPSTASASTPRTW